MRKIKLPNRDGAELYLTEQEGGHFVIESPTDILYTKYLRIIGNEFNDLEAVDPPGGPFISKGSIWDNMKVAKISWSKDEALKIFLEDVTV